MLPAYYMGLEPRDAWHAIGQINLRTEAIRLFEAGQLHANDPASGRPMVPTAPPATGDSVGQSLLRKLHDTKLAVLSIDPAGTGLIIPSDDDLPVRVDQALREQLAELRESFPPPAKRAQNVDEASDAAVVDPPPPPQEEALMTTEFASSYTVVRQLDHPGGWLGS